MTQKSISERLRDKYGNSLYQKSLKFPRNKIYIYFIRKEPLKIRSIIVDNDREYLLVIDDKKNEIFHDCPLFRIHSEKEKKICVHFIRLISILNPQLSNKIFGKLDSYIYTSEDFHSRKRSKNYQLLANECFDANNCVEGLNYLNKAIVNQFESESIITEYLKKAIENNLLIEFFEFLEELFTSLHQREVLSNTIQNDYKNLSQIYEEYIELGFKKLFKVIHQYSFYNLLKIIESIDTIIIYKDFSFLSTFFDKFKKLTNSANFNDNYFSIYFIKKHKEQLIKLNNDFGDLITEDRLNSLRNELIIYFLSEIDNFCLLDKLKLLKKQFKVIEVPKERYIQEYKKYKREIKQLEKRLYLKKFAFLKLLIEKYNIVRAKGGFRKKRSEYIVTHEDDNIKSPVYNYIISRIGFFGLNEQSIKSPEIGINYFIMRELFLDDFSAFQDVNYYKTQFWGESDYTIQSIDGFSLLSKNIEHNNEVELKNSEDVNIIEWDLASKPIQGSIVSAYGSQNIIPDQNNPLFHDLNPFDLCYCKKTPIKIESNIIKTVNVIRKCSFKDAIQSVSKGMTFIDGFYPLTLVKSVLDKDISPFQANELVTNSKNKNFVPNYSQFIQAFREFLFNFIIEEKKLIFDEIKSDIEEKSDQLLILLNLNNELSGLNLDFSRILKEILAQETSLDNFRSSVLNKIHENINDILEKKDLGSTEIFDLKKLRNTQFFKYVDRILKIRRDEFESTRIKRTVLENKIKFDISEIIKTYYGKKFSEILLIKQTTFITQDKFKKFQNFASKMKLNLNIDI
ncbi:MAG: hypothetical protein ACFFE4_15850 [Candidatus Thorarchaeota archaeon]